MRSVLKFSKQDLNWDLSGFIYLHGGTLPRCHLPAKMSNTNKNNIICLAWLYTHIQYTCVTPQITINNWHIRKLAHKLRTRTSKLMPTTTSTLQMTQLHDLKQNQLKMTTAQVVETSVTTKNSLFRDYPHPDDHATETTDTPEFKPFTKNNITKSFISTTWVLWYL